MKEGDKFEVGQIYNISRDFNQVCEVVKVDKTGVYVKPISGKFFDLCFREDDGTIGFHNSPKKHWVRLEN